MRIAINAADLDHERIDGTRIYIQNCLKQFGFLDSADRFFIYHRNKFNSRLAFKQRPNYAVRRLWAPFFWTQTAFALEIFFERPDVLWMPMHSLPYLRSKKTKTVVTIHDLAFKLFPDHYPARHVRRLNLFTDYAVRNADRLIAVSHSTKSDLLKLYPGLREEKIKVIYHGYDKRLFNENISPEQIKAINTKYQIPDTKYLIYVGALQPRKNIGILLEAFEKLKRDTEYKDLALVITGDKGWLYDDILRRIEKTEGVIATGKFETEELPALLAGAEALILPSLYEGFGMPALEAMACGTPVIAADNSSLAEIVGNAGLLFDAYKWEELADALKKLLESGKLRDDLRKKGLERAKDFSWEKCVRETLEWLTKW